MNTSRRSMIKAGVAALAAAPFAANADANDFWNKKRRPIPKTMTDGPSAALDAKGVVTVPSRTVPVYRTCDVLVMGGGIKQAVSGYQPGRGGLVLEALETTFDLNGISNKLFTAATGLGSVINSSATSATLSLGYNNASGDWNAAVAASVPVEKIGTGTLTIGANAAARPAHVVAKIADAGKYVSLNPHFGKAFKFLARTDLATLAVGRYEIDGDNCWAMVQEAKLTPLKGAKVEAHRKYIDIQAPISGSETMGLMTMDAKGFAAPFDVEKDFVLFDAETKPVTLQPGEFAIFFPPDGAHAPCHSENGPRTIHKLVIKVKDVP